MIDGVVDIKKYFWDADPDALDYNRHYFWIIERDTFLAGGTAAALYLGHRESIDIDLFTNESNG